MRYIRKRRTIYDNRGVFTLEFIIIMPIFLVISFLVPEISLMYSEKHKFRLDLYYLVRSLSFEYNNKNNEIQYDSDNDGKDKYKGTAKDLSIDVCKKIGEKYKVSYEYECRSYDGIISIQATKKYKLKFLNLSILNYLYKSRNFKDKDPIRSMDIDIHENIVMSNESFLNQDKKDWDGYIRGVCNLNVSKNDWKKWIKELAREKMNKR